MRKYLRHPSAVPIRYTLLDGNSEANTDNTLKNVSGGGLSFHASEPLEVGTVIRVAIRVKIPPFEADATVIWCNKVGGEYEIGVRFLHNKNDFVLRMVQQVCEVEQYKQDILEQEGRRLSSEEAAAEWIAKHAKDFPR